MRHMLRLLPLPRIVVDEKRNRKRLAHLRTERSPDGELVLQRRPDGACVHFGERGCAVYEPAAGGVPHLRLPRLRRDEPCRALRSQSRNPGLGVRGFGTERFSSVSVMSVTVGSGGLD